MRWRLADLVSVRFAGGPFSRAARLRRDAAKLRATPELNLLLGRRAVSLDTPELQRFVAGRRVLVTGAGGSIGSELCRQSARFCPDRLILLERSEAALFEIHRELTERWVGLDVRPVLADVVDPIRLARIVAEHRPQLLFHAAAHKHVPMTELNPGEAVRNNVLGTRHALEVAVHAGVDAFVLISTDKAVNPSSVMGATKRVAEMLVQHAADVYPKTRCCCVRFGNVIGSSGSVVPIFQKQIEQGGPVTVTHPHMLRYFMTIPEATQLVMQAGAIGSGGEVFLLDMGQPVSILDLARRMIAHAGLVEGRDIHIRFTGVRPGEKLFEQLNTDDEHTAPTPHEKIRVVTQKRPDAARLRQAIERLEAVVDAPPAIVRGTLQSAVNEYAPTNAQLTAA